jgi:hypothetical protein
VTNLFSPRPLAGWQATRDLLQGYARAAGRIRRLHAPAYKHWWHACLYVTATGLTTTPMATGDQDDDRLAAGEQALDCPEFGQQSAIYDAGAVEDYWQALS